MLKYEVIDDQGNVVETIPYEKGYRADRMTAQYAAWQAARRRELNTFELSWNQLWNMRKDNS